ARLEGLDADEIGAGEAVAPDIDVLHDLLVLVADDTLDDSAGRGRQGQIGSVDRLGPRTIGIGESLSRERLDPARHGLHVPVPDRGTLDRERDDLLGAEALDAEPALGIGLRLA